MGKITQYGNGDSALVRLPGYGVNAEDVFVPINQVAQFKLINHNGIGGTEVQLVCGQKFIVEVWPNDLAIAIAHAANPPKENPLTGDKA